MLNIEIKSVLRDRAGVEQRLKAMDAEYLLVLRQRDTFYSVPTGWLKLREHDEGEPELISYLRPTDTAEARPANYDLAVIEDPALWKSLLGRVLPLDVVVQKERTVWRIEHTRVHLDRVEELGDYIELETAATDIGLEAAREECDRIVCSLGLDRAEFLSVPYRDLLA